MPAQRDNIRTALHRPSGAVAGDVAPSGVVVLARSAVPSRLMAAAALAERVLRDYRLRTIALQPAGRYPRGKPAQSPLPSQAQTARLVGLLDRERQLPYLEPPADGLFADGDLAAPAVRAAILRPGRLAALVLLDAGPEVTAGLVSDLRAPILLIASGADIGSVRHSRMLMRAMDCRKRLEIIPESARCADESGIRQAVLHLAASWFAAHLNGRDPVQAWSMASGWPFNRPLGIV